MTIFYNMSLQNAGRGKFHKVHMFFFTQSPLEDLNLTSTISRKHGFFHRMKHFWSTFFFNLLKKSINLGSGFHLSSVVVFNKWDFSSVYVMDPS